MMFSLPVILLALIAINGLTILQFWNDKRAACEGRRRISEADLLFLSAIGGTPGAFVARKMFRYKTRKEPFSTQLFVIAALQMGAALGLAFF